MTKPRVAVRARNLSKEFRLFPSPAERLLAALGVKGRRAPEAFWALRDVSVDVPAGSTVGIVGCNGSGKSTLLHLVCGILRPSSGEIQVDGRIAAILDLGSGFSPELTGRENVRLRGSTLGIGRREMEQRTREIEQFADIGSFFDRPVKIYSSGMFVRLAFAAAINTDPDVLVIDEALAVGDARFQHKCYQKLNDIRSHGKSILLVSHNMDAVVRHCDRAYLLDGGAILEQGDPRDVVSAYLELSFTGKLASYQARPTLTESSFHGFNIVHFRKTYYALSVSLGPVNLIERQQQDLDRWEEAGQLIMGDTLEEVKAGVRGLTGCGGPHDAGRGEPQSAARRRAIDRFLQQASEGDRCASRSSYNPHERRFGDRRGEIVDYLTVSDRAVDLFEVGTGDEVDVYLKARFRQDVERPMFGFSLKAKDGVVVHASNSRYQGIVLQSARADDCVVFRFSLSLPLHAGDYFLDLGLAEMLPDCDVPIDIRHGIVHLVVQSDGGFDGLVNLSTGAEEVTRL